LYPGSPVNRRDRVKLFCDRVRCTSVSECIFTLRK
jgi:hypothetical protein